MIDALRHQVNGDYEETIAAYLAILEHDPTPAETRQARFHLAETYLLNGDYPDAASAWESFLAGYPEDPQAPQAALMAARAYRALDMCETSIPLLQQNVDPETVLADMAYEWIGDCYTGIGRLEEALAAYRDALEMSRIPDVEAGIREKVASIHLTKDEHSAALAEYEAILSLALDEEHHARIEFSAGQVLAAMDHPGDAYMHYQRAVEGSPESDFAYLSLLELKEAGQKVDAFQAGLAYYYAGESHPGAYGAAIRAFDRYLAQEQAFKADEALYYKALAERAAGNMYAALATLQQIIRDHPNSPWAEQAWFEKGVTLGRAGSTDKAIKTCRKMGDVFPGGSLAPQALWEVVSLQAGTGAVAQTAKLYREMHVRFPGSEHADEALWRAGFIHYLANDLDKAAIAWNDLVEAYASSPFSAGALYWLGKLEGAGASQPESKRWDQLVDLHPFDYYALRAAQIRSRASLTSTRFVLEPVSPPLWDANETEAQLVQWMEGWTEAPTGTEPGSAGLTETSGPQPRLERIQALLEIGLRKEASTESESVLSVAWNDPLTLGRLAIFFHDQDLHELAARSAVRLAELWPEGRLSEAPRALMRLAYPLVFADLLSAESQNWGLDPLLLASLIRQESLFEPSAESSAGARGLSQIMPATGRQIRRHLGIDSYNADDLYRPSVSIQFGAYYLAIMLQVFDDQIPVALAAYNGGPGNTQRWMDAVAGDLDLFAETIPSEESRRFLRRVYEGYVIYETLYRSSEPSE